MVLGALFGLWDWSAWLALRRIISIAHYDKIVIIDIQFLRGKLALFKTNTAYDTHVISWINLCYDELLTVHLVDILTIVFNDISFINISNLSIRR